MAEKTFLSIVVPCYNEAANLRRGVLSEMAAFLNKQKYSWEVIISDDGSSDESARLVKTFLADHPGFRLLKNPHQGKAHALLAGIKKTRGRLVLMTDMDQSTPLSEVKRLLPWFKKGYQAVIGSRGLVRKGAPWYRQLMAWGFRFLRGLFILPEINDTQCGFKAFDGRAVRLIFPRLAIFSRHQRVQGWRVSAFDVELLFLFKKWGHRLREVAVRWEDLDIAKGKKHNFLKESKNMALEIIRVRLNDWQGRYG